MAGYLDGELHGTTGIFGIPLVRRRHWQRLLLTPDGTAECRVREEEQTGIQVAFSVFQ